METEQKIIKEYLRYEKFNVKISHMIGWTIITTMVAVLYGTSTDFFYLFVLTGMVGIWIYEINNLVKEHNHFFGGF